jgi:hypothetical protein
MSSKGRQNKKSHEKAGPKKSPAWVRAGYSSPEAYRRDKRDAYDNEGNHRRSGSWPRSAKHKHIIKAADLVADAAQRATQSRLKNIGDIIMLPYWNAAAKIIGATVDANGHWLYETDSIFMRLVSQDELERQERGVVVSLVFDPEPVLLFELAV